VDAKTIVDNVFCRSRAIVVVVWVVARAGVWETWSCDRGRGAAREDEDERLTVDDDVRERSDG
jgi:hypothetical protein